MNAQIGNRLIEHLPGEYREALYSKLQPVSLPTGTTLFEPEATPEYAHFMTSGVTSLVTFMSDGSAAEVGVVGSEGVVEGFHLLSPASVTTVQTRGFVQIAGTALRIKFAELGREFQRIEPLRALILGFVQSQVSLLGQLAACNRLHEVEERLARWLLMMQDRTGDDTFPLTQEFMAMMLGTRRTSVTLAASSLQRGGLIEYRRGKVHILRRDLLEDAACECYLVTRKLLTGLYRF